MRNGAGYYWHEGGDTPEPEGGNVKEMSRVLFGVDFRYRAF